MVYNTRSHDMQAQSSNVEERAEGSGGAGGEDLDSIMMRTASELLAAQGLSDMVRISSRRTVETEMEGLSIAEDFLSSSGSAFSGSDIDSDSDLFGAAEEFRDSLRSVTGIGKSKRARKRGRAQASNRVSPEVQQLLGQANLLFVEKRLDAAIPVLQEAIRLSPQASAAWHTLALIHEEMGQRDKAAKLYMVAAHLSPNDAAQWKRLAAMYRELAEQHNDKADRDADITQALYSITKAAKLDPDDTDCWYERIALEFEKGDWRALARSYKSVIRRDPHNLHLIREAAPILVHKTDDTSAPVKWFTDAFEYYNTKALPHSVRRRRKNIDIDTDDSDASDRSDESDGSDETDDEALLFGEDAYGEYLAMLGQLGPQQSLAMEVLNGYTYSDANMVAELLLLRAEHERAVRMVKRCARFVQGRGGELHWERAELRDDSEYEHNELPIELRVKLGQARLHLGDIDIGKHHLEELFVCDISAFSDLFMDVAETFANIGHTAEAIDVYRRLLDCTETNTPVVWAQLAACYRDAGDLANAAQYAEAAISVDPTEVDLRLWLGEVYEEMGEVDLALKLMQVVEEIQAAEQSLDQAPEHDPEHDYNPENIVVIRTRTRAQPSALSAARSQAESASRKKYLAARKEADLCFKKLSILTTHTDAAALDEYCTTAHRLYADWTRTAVFYMSDRSRPFRGYRSTFMNNIENGISQPTDTQSSVQRRVARLKKRLTHNQPSEPSEPDSVPVTFRGHNFSEWADVFLEYARALALTARTSDACAVLDKVYQSNVFVRQTNTRRAFKLLELAIAVHAADHYRMYDTARWFCGLAPTHAVAYKLFASAMCSSAAAAAAMGSSSMYKYMRRQMAVVDDIYYSRRDEAHLPSLGSLAFPSAQPETDIAVATTRDQVAMTRADIAAMHALTGNIMLQSGSALTATMQYTQAVTLSPNDPSVALSLAVSYIVRCAARKVDNRHLIVLQAFAYMQRYAELRYLQMAGQDASAPQGAYVDVVVSQEIAYNVARAFHQLGLEHIAVAYYRRVFELPPTLGADLKYEAAYNLAAIYVASGSMHLARELMKKYCVV